MTNEQQHTLTNRIISEKRKKLFKLTIDNRGRELKIEENHQLASILKSFFDKGGMEAHPRLTTSTIFRHEKNNLFMWQAREKILLNAPENFKVSLSTCYNYTMNYRENSRAAKQHHHGKNIGADISLKRPPHSNTRQVNIFIPVLLVKLF